MLPNDVKQIEDAFEQLILNLPGDLTAYLKNKFEQSLPSFLGRMAKAEVHLVADASQIISEVGSYVKRGKSTFLEVAREPFMKFFAPQRLQSEVAEKIPKIAREMKLDETKLREVWETLFMPHINFREPEDFVSQFKAYLSIGGRDPEDIPYVALTFSAEMHGIVTKDKDISDQPEVRTWRFGKIRQVITVMKKGSLSFFVSSELLSPMLQALFQILANFLRAVFHFITKLVQTIARAIDKGIDSLGRLPEWAQLLLVMGAIGVLVNEKARNELVASLKEAARSIATFLNDLYLSIKGIIEPIGRVLEIVLVVLYVVLNGVNQGIAEVRALSGP